MANEIIQSKDGVVYVRISGVMTPKDQRALVALGEGLIDAGQKVCALVTLEDFKGWETNEAWSDDLQFMLDYSNEVARIAIVADERWKTDAFMFVGKGFRDTEIEFFPTGSMQAAEAWIRR